MTNNQYATYQHALPQHVYGNRISTYRFLLMKTGVLQKVFNVFNGHLPVTSHSLALKQDILTIFKLP